MNPIWFRLRGAVLLNRAHLQSFLQSIMGNVPGLLAVVLGAPAAYGFLYWKLRREFAKGLLIEEQNPYAYLAENVDGTLALMLVAVLHLFPAVFLFVPTAFQLERSLQRSSAFQAFHNRLRSPGILAGALQLQNAFFLVFFVDVLLFPYIWLPFLPHMDGETLQRLLLAKAVLYTGMISVSTVLRVSGEVRRMRWLAHIIWVLSHCSPFGSFR